MKINRTGLLMLLIIIILAAVLRFSALGQESLWSDESGTVRDIKVDSAAAVLQQADALEQQPPGYFLLLYYWSKLFGTSEFSLRLPSVIFGVLSVLFIFLLAQELWGTKAGLISAALMALSPVQILYSQDARAYSLFALLTLVSFYYFYSVLKKPTKQSWFLYGWFTVLSLYTHYFALLSIFLQLLIFWLVARKEVLKKFLLMQLVIGLLSIPVFVYLVRDLIYIHPHLTSVYRSLNIPFLELLGVGWFVLPFLGAILVAVLIKINWQRIVKIKSIRIPEFVFVSFVLMIYLLATLNLERLITPFFLTRFSLFLMPAFYLFLAWGLTRITAPKRMLALLTILLLLYCSFLPTYYGTVKKEQWRETAELISVQGLPGELILFDADYTQRSFDYYYSGGLERRGLLAGSEPENQLFFQQLQPRLSSSSGIWLILSHNNRNDDFYKLLLDLEYQLVGEWRFKGVEVYRYQT